MCIFCKSKSRKRKTKIGCKFPKDRLFQIFRGKVLFNFDPSRFVFRERNSEQRLVVVDAENHQHVAIAQRKVLAFYFWVYGVAVSLLNILSAQHILGRTLSV